MHKLWFTVLTVMLLVIAASAAPPSILLVGTSICTNSSSGYVISSTNALAQEFTVDAPVKARSITFVVGGSYKDTGGGMGGFGRDVTFLAQLTEGIGQGSVVFAQQEFTFSSSPDKYYAAIFIVDGLKKLPAGTYYLVLSTKSPSDVGTLTWAPNAEVASPFGHLGIAYYANPTGYDHPNEAPFIPATIGSQTLQFQLSGNGEQP